MKSSRITSAKFLPAALTVLVVVLLGACDFLIGPQGEQGEIGEQGPPGSDGVPPAVYLADGNGTRVFHGGVYYLGEAYGGFPTVSSLFLVNNLTTEATFSGMTPIFHWYVDPVTGDMTVPPAAGEISADTAGVTGSVIVPDGQSPLIDFTLASVAADRYVWKRYRIDLVVDGGDDFSFTFDVYGLNRSST